MGKEENMKLGNVILAIFFWLMIPLVFLVGPYGFAVILGLGSSGMICPFVSSFILFILGIVVLLKGREKTKKETPVSETKADEGDLHNNYFS